MSTTHGGDTRGPASPSHHDSIEEMASMLLEDTAMAPADNSNETQSSDCAVIPDGHAPNASANCKSDSTTPAPHRSSQRKSATNTHPDGGTEPGHRQVYGSESKNIVESNNPPPTLRDIPQAKPSTTNAADLNSKIEAMLAATQALKPDAANPLLQGRLPTKKRRLKDGNVLTKMKTVMTYHLQSRANKKLNDPTRTPDDEVAVPLPALTSMEIRMNEGQYFIYGVIYRTDTRPR